MMHMKSLLRGATMLVLAFVCLGISRASAADPGCIYYVDWRGPGAPIVENEQYFTKIFETAPGSKVYEGEVEFYGVTWFRFYSTLQDCHEYDPEFSWKKGNIGPGGSDHPMTAAGKSGVYFADNVKDLPWLAPSEEAGTWFVQAEGPCLVTVDLGKGTLRVLPKNTVWTLVNDSRTPDLEKPENYVNVKNLKTYVPEGNLDIRFYAPCRKTWLTAGSTSLVSGYNYISLNDGTSPTAFSASGWPGGVVEGDYSYGNEVGIVIKADGTIKTAYSSPQIYTVGDFSNWAFYEGNKVEAANSEGTLFNITVPAGTQMFKIATDANWDLNFGSDGNIVRNPSGEFVIGLKRDGNNFEFDNTLTSPLQATVDLQEMTITFPSEAPLTANGGGSDLDPDDAGALYLAFASEDLEIWNGAPSSVRSYYQKLPQTGANEWAGTVTIPWYAYRFNLIKDLTEKGQPNTVIAPKGDKDHELFFNDWYAYSSAALYPSDKAHYWTYGSWGGGDVNLKVTFDGTAYILAVDNVAQVQASEIYIVGEPQGWDIYSPAMPLRQTDRGGYYGNYFVNEGSPYLRFYTALGDWDSNSIGSQIEDSPISIPMGDGYFSTYCVNGKGAWQLEGWPGGEMYFYVDLDNMYVTFSANPIPEAGDFITTPDRQAVKTGAFVGRDEMTKRAEGVYSAVINTYRDQDIELRLFTRLLPISEDEPEYLGSYTVAPAGDGIFDLSKGSSVTFDIVTNDNISATPAKAFSLVNANTGSHRLALLLDLNARKLTVTDMSGAYILPDGTPSPDETNAEKFEGYRISNYGGILDIPAGEFNVWYAQPEYGRTQQPDVKAVISFEDDPFVVEKNEYDYNQGWGATTLSCPTWKGGKVYLGWKMAYDLSKLKEVTVYADSVRTVFKETAPGSLVYKGTVSFEKLSGALYTHGLNFILAEKREKVKDPWNDMEYDQLYQLVVGAKSTATGTGYYPTMEERSLYLGSGSGSATAQIGFNGSGFRLPDISHGTYEVTLDLNTLALTVTEVEGAAATLYETVAAEGSPLNASVSYLSSELPGAIVVEAVGLPGSSDSYAFNLAGTNGKVLVPAEGGNVALSFNEQGIWKGSYSEISASSAPSHSERKDEARKAAAAEGKWSFSVPTGRGDTDLSILIDESSKTITVFSMAHNNSFFIALSSQYNTQRMPTVANIAASTVKALKATAPGVYTAKIEYTSDTPSDYSDYISFHSNVIGSTTSYFGIAVDNYNFSSFDMTQNPSVALNAYDSYHSYNDWNVLLNAYASSWQFIASPGWYDIEYDANARSLTISQGESAVEEIPTDAEEVRPVIIPGNGSITVISPTDTSVSIYTLNGILVRTLDVKAGTVTVDIAPGFYIAGGSKIVVR